MSKKNEHKSNSLLQVLLYLKGVLRGRERNTFEKKIQKEAFEEEAMEGFESISPQELEEDILNLNTRIDRRTKRKSRFIYYRIAASFAVLIAVSALYFMLSDREIKEFPGTPGVTEAVSTDTLKKQEKSIENGTPTEETPEEKAISEKEEISRDLHTDIPAKDLAEETTKTEESIISREPEVSIEEDIIPAPNENKNQQEVREITAAREPESEESRIAVSPIPKSKVDSEEAYSTKSMARTRKMAMPVSEKSSPQQIISGVVLSSEDSLPIPGASITVKGTATGTVTDPGGRFELLVDDENPLLVASFIGMEEKEINAETGNDLRIIMEPSDVGLDEVVVIGYGNQKKSETTGAISTIEDFDNQAKNTWQGAYPVKGTRDFKKYIEENIHYPDTRGSEREVVVLKFIILPEGRPSNIKILRSPGEKFSREAKRLLKNGPDWVPASNDGNYVADENRIRLVFKK